MFSFVVLPISIFYRCSICSICFTCPKEFKKLSSMLSQWLWAVGQNFRTNVTTNLRIRIKYQEVEVFSWKTTSFKYLMEVYNKVDSLVIPKIIENKSKKYGKPPKKITKNFTHCAIYLKKSGTPPVTLFHKNFSHFLNLKIDVFCNY